MSEMKVWQDRPVRLIHGNTFERVLRAVREILTIVVLALIILTFAVSFAAVRSIGERLGGADSGVIEPAPTDTTCPFGEGECGG